MTDETAAGDDGGDGGPRPDDNREAADHDDVPDEPHPSGASDDESAASTGSAEAAGGVADEAADDEPGEDADPAADRRPAEASTTGEGDGSFLGNLTSPRKQLGKAADAFRNARAASNLPRDEEDRVKLVCRRHAERRAVPLDDLGRPSCFDEDHPDCQGCLEDVRDGTVETW